MAPVFLTKKGCVSMGSAQLRFHELRGTPGLGRPVAFGPSLVAFQPVLLRSWACTSACVHVPVGCCGSLVPRRSVPRMCGWAPVCAHACVCVRVCVCHRLLLTWACPSGSEVQKGVRARLRARRLPTWAWRTLLLKP